MDRVERRKETFRVIENRKKRLNHGMDLMLMMKIFQVVQDS